VFNDILFDIETYPLRKKYQDPSCTLDILEKPGTLAPAILGPQYDLL
jgi:hypothetical protein